jgi:hypothetical protein
MAGARARALLAAQLTPAPPNPGTGRGVWGPPIDQTGLLDQIDRLPGLIAPEEFQDLLAGPGTPTSALLAAIRSRTPAAAPSLPSIQTAPNVPTALNAPSIPAAPSAPSIPTASARPAMAPAEQASRPAPPRSALGSLPSEIRALIADPQAAAATIRGEAPPPGVLEWLDRLARLHTIPFPLLVPDTRALPPESIRFAHLDANWISALVDGALSVAAVDEPGHAVLDLLRPAVYQALAPHHPAADPAPALSGFLLRSTAVADFPGLIVQGYADRERRRPLTLRRLDRLSPTVLFALFEGRVGRVDLATPAQGAGFGVLFSSRNPGGEVYLRGIGDSFRSGEQIPGAVVAVPFRADSDPSARIIDIGELYASILRSLAGLYAPEPVPPFGPGAFGLQLVVGGETQAFDNLDAAEQGRR